MCLLSAASCGLSTSIHLPGCTQSGDEDEDDDDDGDDDDDNDHKEDEEDEDENDGRSMVEWVRCHLYVYIYTYLFLYLHFVSLHIEMLVPVDAHMLTCAHRGHQHVALSTYLQLDVPIKAQK